MKKNSVLRRMLGLTGSAVLLAGLFTGFSLKSPGALTLETQADSYSISAGNFCRVDADSLNIRSGPGLSYARQGSLRQDAMVEILETRGDWGRIGQGWIHMDYLRPASQVSQEASAGIGYVNATSLNVRTGPGTEYAVCGQVTEGYRLNLLEIQNGWARISDGWVSLRYVNRSSSPSAPSGNAGISANTSVRVVADMLNVRQGPGTEYAKIGTLVNGKVVNILEIRGLWGRTSGGWISLNYVRPAEGRGEPAYHTSLAGNIEVTADSLMVRTGPGVVYQPCGMMTRGYRATVYEIRNGWGRISDGWISLDYVRWLR